MQGMTKEEFKRLRLQHHLTQKAMAELLDVHPNYISRLERLSDITTPVNARIEKLVRLLLRERKSEKSSQTP
jgi:transcriptional regulator with XRE-family HTH domain